MKNLILDTFHQVPFDWAEYADTREFIETQAPTTPTYLFSARELENQVDVFTRGFPGEVSYAVKANPHADVIRSLWEQGIRSFDVASINEIRLVRALFPQAHLHYNNPVKTDLMVATAYNSYGVRSFVVDDRAGLEQVLGLGDPDVEVTVRFKLEHANAAYDFGSKFGATPEQATELLAAVGGSGYRASLTFHPGSQCIDDRMYQRYILVAARITEQAGVSLHRLNVGGGFPVPYRDSDVPTLKAYFNRIRDAVEEAFPGDAPALLCEPGRALVASSTSLVTQVIHVREEGAVYINDGIYGGLQEQLVTDIRLPYRVWRGGEVLATAAVSTTVFGPTCDPVDRLPVRLALPADIQAGDWIEFGLLGAYGSATATQFNGFISGNYSTVREGYGQLAASRERTAA